MTETIYYTPLGEPVKESELEEQERIVCDFCDFAILGDEIIPCETCSAVVCLYCWQGDYWICPGCHKIHASMIAA